MSAPFSSGLETLVKGRRQAAGQEPPSSTPARPFAEDVPRRREPTFDELVSGVMVDGGTAPTLSLSIPSPGDASATDAEDPREDEDRVAPFGDRRPVRADSLGFADDPGSLLPERRRSPLAVVGGTLLILVLGLLLCAIVWFGLTGSTSGLSSPPEWAPDWLRSLLWPFAKE